MWIVCITSVRHVLTVNGYGGRQTKENEKSWCFKGWETLVINNMYKHNPFIMQNIRANTLIIGANNNPINKKVRLNADFSINYKKTALLLSLIHI